MRRFLSATLAAAGIAFFAGSAWAAPINAGAIGHAASVACGIGLAQYYDPYHRPSYRRCWRERVCDYYGRCWYERRCNY